MGKRSSNYRDDTTRVLYKKSFHTNYTQSRTCSGITNRNPECTTSGLFSIKNNVSGTKQYYLEGGKVKRDLSIETDICIIRRYFKKMKNTFSVREGSISKQSTVADPEVNAIDEFDANESACGDNEQTKEAHVKRDTLNVVVDNLKDLIYNWIQKYLHEAKMLDYKDLDNVLCTILPKEVTSKTAKSSSRSTYILNRSTISQVKNKKIGTGCKRCKQCKRCRKQSKRRESDSVFHSTPTHSKKIMKVISTLSIPRNLHKKTKEEKRKSNPKTKEVARKKLILSTNKSDNVDISGLDFLSVSAETFTRLCANIKLKKNGVGKMKRRILFFPKPFYKSATNSVSSEGDSANELSPRDNLVKMPSLLQSMYAENPADLGRSSDGSKFDKFTMPDNNLTLTPTKDMTIDEPHNLDKPSDRPSTLKEPLITIDFIDEITNNSTKAAKESVSLKTLMKKTELPTKQHISPQEEQSRNMEFETDMSKHKIIQPPKSATINPSNYSTFVVAFSLKETYDDLVTAQQMICNKYSPQNRSPQDSINSITPTNSLKIIDNDTPQPSNADIEHHIFIEDPSTSTLEIDQPVLVEDKIQIEDPIAIEQRGLDDEIEDIIKFKRLVPKNSLKTVFNEPMQELDQISIHYSFNEDYQIEYEENVSNEEQATTEPEQLQENNSIESAVITNILIKNEVLFKKSSINCMTFEKELELVDINVPEILFDVKRNRKTKETKSPKRKSRNYRSAEVISKHFKHKNSKINIHAQIGRYCNKTVKKSFNSEQIQKVLCSEYIATIVSRSSFQCAPLRTVLAKENLFKKTEVINNNEDKSYNSMNTSEISITVTDKSFSAYNSDTTLIDAKSSNTDESYTADAVSSVIKIHENNIYKSEVITVAEAVACNTKKGYSSQPILVTKDENIELTSTEALMSPIFSFISKPSAHASEISEISIVTLVNNKSSIKVLSDNDTYSTEKISSEITKTSDVDFNLKPKDSTQASMSQKNLLDAVINLGMYTEASPSTSSAGTYDIIDRDNVIVTGLNKSYPINPNLIKFNTDYIISDNILKKNNLPAKNLGGRNLNLPNQSEIKALIIENETSQSKCAEEARHPTSFPEMWERLVCVIDLAVKRLEDTLSERLIKELKKSLNSFEVNNNYKSWKDSKDVEMMSGDIRVLNKEVATGEVRNETEQGMQCDLVNNKTIDDLILKMSTEGPKMMSPVATKSFPKIKSNIFKDFFEVIKPPQTPLVIEKSEKMTITVSTLSDASEIAKFRRLRMALRPPINFFRENVLVLASVPSFLFLMACLYGVMLLVIKPW